MMNPEQTALALEAAMDALRNDLVEGRIKNLPLHLEQIEPEPRLPAGAVGESRDGVSRLRS